MTLAAIVAAQVGNVFACRTDRESVFRSGLFRNRLVLIGVAAEIALLVGLILIPPLAHVFGLAPLAFEEWRILLLFPPAIILLEETRKWIVRRTRRAADAGPRAGVSGPAPRPIPGAPLLLESRPR
jgi:magnesium-transporting ATPase (P-type)